MQTLEASPTPFFSPLLRRYTLAELWEIKEPDDRSHYELIEGVLHIVPPPAPPHGKIDARLKRSLLRMLDRLDDTGFVYHPREAIYIDAPFGTYLEPDMMYVSSELEASMGDRRTSADIVFEYLSDSTATYDRTTKADTYLALGVKELWLVDSDERAVEVRQARRREGQLFWERRVYCAGEVAESEVLSGWRVPVNEIFANLSE
jgi:Uma2 family endonuclease